MSPIAEYPSDVFARVLAVHVLGAFQVLKHGAPHMPEGGYVASDDSAWMTAHTLAIDGGLSA